MKLWMQMTCCCQALPAALLQQGHMPHIKQGGLQNKQSMGLRHLVMAARRELLPALGRPTMPTSATTCTAAETGLSTSLPHQAHPHSGFM